jgi:hypothetical protein
LIKCIKNFIIDTNLHEPRVNILSEYITVGKNYQIQTNPCSDYVYNIIDDKGNLHDFEKDLFIELNLLRQEKLDLLGL